MRNRLRDDFFSGEPFSHASRTLSNGIRRLSMSPVRRVGDDAASFQQLAAGLSFPRTERRSNDHHAIASDQTGNDAESGRHYG
jgi:hypothetical protein